MKKALLLAALVAVLLGACAPATPTPARLFNLPNTGSAPNTGNVPAAAVPALPAATNTATEAVAAKTAVPTTLPTSTATQPQASAATPTQAAAFSIINVITSARLDSNRYINPGCETSYIFQSNIYASGQGQMTYYWLRSDGTSSAETTIAFTDSDFIKISDTWILSSDGPSVSGTDRVVMVQPIQKTYPAFGVNFYCAPPVPPTKAPRRPGGGVKPTPAPTQKP